MVSSTTPRLSGEALRRSFEGRIQALEDQLRLGKPEAICNNSSSPAVCDASGVTGIGLLGGIVDEAAMERRLQAKLQTWQTEQLEWLPKRLAQAIHDIEDRVAAQLSDLRKELRAATGVSPASSLAGTGAGARAVSARPLAAGRAVSATESDGSLVSVASTLLEARFQALERRLHETTGVLKAVDPKVDPLELFRKRPAAEAKAIEGTLSRNASSTDDSDEEGAELGTSGSSRMYIAASASGPLRWMRRGALRVLGRGEAKGATGERRAEGPSGADRPRRAIVI